MDYPQTSASQVTNPSNGWLRKLLYSVILIILILLSFGTGFFTAINIGNLNQPPGIAADQQIEKNPLIYSNPTTIIQGKITSVSGKTISVTNINGTSGEIELSDKVVISKPGSTGSESGSDLNSIELNKETALSVQVNSGRYEVVSIIYPPVPVPPTSTPSGQLKNTR